MSVNSIQYSLRCIMHRNYEPSRIEAEHLLPTKDGMSEMENLGPQHGNLATLSNGFTVEERSPTEDVTNTAELLSPVMSREANGGQIVYKTYKRRWFGLTQLVLLNIIVSWDVRGNLFKLNLNTSPPAPPPLPP